MVVPTAVQPDDNQMMTYTGSESPITTLHNILTHRIEETDPGVLEGDTVLQNAIEWKVEEESIYKEAEISPRAKTGKKERELKHRLLKRKHKV